MKFSGEERNLGFEFFLLLFLSVEGYKFLQLP